MRNLAVTGTPYGLAAPDRGLHDRPQEGGLGRHRRAAALAGDLRRRAPEVDVDVVDPVGVAQRGARRGASISGSLPYICRLRGRSSGPNVIIRWVLSLPKTTAVAITISFT